MVAVAKWLKQIMIDNAALYKEQVIALLKADNLPVDDLPETLDNFFVALIDNEVVGVAGIEIYGNYGLLRSVAMSTDYRGHGIAKDLVEQIILLGKSKRLSDLYLLTETAAEYFKKNGFAQIEREAVPDKIKASSEFSHVCPVTAIVMKKSI